MGHKASVRGGKASRRPSAKAPTAPRLPTESNTDSAPIARIWKAASRKWARVSRVRPRQANLMSGPSDRTVQMQNAVISNTDTGRRVTDNSITAQYLCNLGAPSNPPPPGWDGAYNLTNNSCYNATLYSTNTTLRLRVNSRAVPGHYQATARFQAQYGGVNYGNPVAVTYNFMVLPKASFTPTPPGSFPEIAGLATWQSNMVNPTPYQIGRA